MICMTRLKPYPLRGRAAEKPADGATHLNKALSLLPFIAAGLN